MSFAKRNKADQQRCREQWQAWCKENAALIAASGAPASVFADEAHWKDFLEMSDLYPTDFDHNRLSLPQKAALLRLISTRPIDCRTPVAGCMIDVVLDALEPRL